MFVIKGYDTGSKKASAVLNRYELDGWSTWTSIYRVPEHIKEGKTFETKEGAEAALRLIGGFWGGEARIEEL